MGKKISWEDAEKLGRLDKRNDDIILPPNKYGYRINISHPLIRPHYERYKHKLGEIRLSDAQRLEFEMIILNLIERKKHEQGNTDRALDGGP